MNLVTLLGEWVRNTPAAPALISSKNGTDTRVSFAELEERIAACAGQLRGSGLQAGDPVLVFQPMSAELYVVLLALLRLGALAVFLDPSAGRAHLEHCCTLLPPRALVATPKAFLLCLRSPALRRIPRKFSTGRPVPFTTRLFSKVDNPVQENFAATDDTPALLTFTSGSTGQPKGAVRTHGLLLAQYAALRPAIALESGAADLATLPVFALANLAAGMATVIPDADLRRPGAIDPKPVLRQISRLGVTRCTASPAFFECLLAAPPTEGAALQQLRRIYTGGAPVFPDLLRRLADACPAATPVAVYGSTEAEPVAHIALGEMTDADLATMRSGGGLLAGHPVPEVMLRLDDTANAGWGEILVSGAHVLRGYLNGTGDAENKVRDGDRIWHRTGDAGRLDDTGRLWLLGRISAVIRDAHGTVHPFAVECAARQLPWIRRSALIAWEKKRVLVVETTLIPSPNKLVELQTLLAWVQLDEVIRVDKIPVDKRHNAKVDYPALLHLLKQYILIRPNKIE